MRTVERVRNTADHAAASMLVPVTASLTAARTFGLSQYAPTPVLWASIGIAEALKAFTALLLAIGQYENLGTFTKDFFSKVIAPAAWTVACAFAVMGKILFGKPADAVVFAPAFAYNSAIKLCSAANHYRKNEAYGNDLVIAAAMAMLSVGVSGILLNANPMVVLAFSGAMLNLFNDVVCPVALLANLRIPELSTERSALRVRLFDPLPLNASREDDVTAGIVHNAKADTDKADTDEERKPLVSGYPARNFD